MRLIFIIEPMLYSKKKDCIVQSFFLYYFNQGSFASLPIQPLVGQS